MTRPPIPRQRWMQSRQPFFVMAWRFLPIRRRAVGSNYQIGPGGIFPYGIFKRQHMSRRITVESLSCINVTELNRLGAFARPMEFTFMGLRTSPNLIEYRGPKWPADRPPQRIPIQRTRCNYGGTRPWFTCLCGRRVGMLYRGSAWLGCRHCAEATYESQKKSRRGRLHLKATRIRARLRLWPPRRRRYSITAIRDAAENLH